MRVGVGVTVMVRLSPVKVVCVHSSAGGREANPVMVYVRLAVRPVVV